MHVITSRSNYECPSNSRFPFPTWVNLFKWDQIVLGLTWVARSSALTYAILPNLKRIAAFVYLALWTYRLSIALLSLASTQLKLLGTSDHRLQSEGWAKVSEIFWKRSALTKTVGTRFQLAHVDQLPQTGFDVIIAPLKLKGGSGGPTRVFAVRHSNGHNDHKSNGNGNDRDHKSNGNSNGNGFHADSNDVDHDDKKYYRDEVTYI